MKNKEEINGVKLEINIDGEEENEGLIQSHLPTVRLVIRVVFLRVSLPAAAAKAVDVVVQKA